MAQYEFDSVRWCRTMAKAHWMRNEHDISSTFRTVAEEMDNLRAENERLKAGLSDIAINIEAGMRENKALRAENEQLRRDVAALKEAVRPVARGWGMVRKQGDDAVLNCAGSGYRLPAETLDALAALVWEE